MSLKQQHIIVHHRKIVWFLIAVILSATFVVHSPALKNGFTNWDDNWHIHQYFSTYHLDRITPDALSHVFTDFDTFDMYIPMIVLSWMVEYQIGGLDPFIYHLDNILIHMISTVLLFILFYNIFQRVEPAFLISLLFGTGTINVESVAWISGRKDLLYGLFFIASLLSYVIYRKNSRPAAFVLSLLFFLLALMSKAQSAFLAPTLFLIDYVMGVPFTMIEAVKKKEGEKATAPVRYARRVNVRLLAEKMPFFLLALIFGCLAVYAVIHNPAYTKMQFSFLSKTVFASYGLVNYLLKSFVPYSLSAVYPYPVMEGNTIPGTYYLFLLPALFIVLVPFFTFRKNRPLTFGLSFAILNIVAVLQFFSNSNLIMGDHYTYISSIGYYYLAASALLYLADGKQKSRPILIGCLIIYMAGIGFFTFQRAGVWKDSLTLWNDVLKKYPRSMEALIKRGKTKMDTDDFKGALKDFETAVILHGNIHGVHQYKGICLENMKKFEDAIYHYREDLKKDPRSIDSIRGIGRSCYATGAYSESIEAFRTVNEILPRSPEAYHYTARALLEMNRPKEAVSELGILIGLSPGHAPAYLLRGSAYVSTGDYPSALKDFDSAIEKDPGLIEAYYKRAITNGILENFSAVITDIDRLLERSPEEPFAFYLRGVAKQAMNQDGCPDLKKAMDRGYPGASEKWKESCS